MSNEHHLLRQPGDVATHDGRGGQSLLPNQAPNAADRLRRLFGTTPHCGDERALFDEFRHAINDSRRDGRLLFP